MLRHLRDFKYEIDEKYKVFIILKGEEQENIWTSGRDWTRRKLKNSIEKSLVSPQKITQLDGRDYWVYQNEWYSSTRDLQPEDVQALVNASKVRFKQTLDRAKSLASAKINPTAHKRGQIPADLRLLIWAKYDGCCADCGSSAELQFDHIIPVVMGGATSEENLQILCGSCNRSKGASLG
jgi:hypothetical protein